MQTRGESFSGRFRLARRCAQAGMRKRVFGQRAYLSACLLLGIGAVPRLAAQAPPTELHPQPSAESYFDQSLHDYQVGRFAASIEKARLALARRWNYPAAWNNIAASYNALGLWEDGIRAAEEALRLQPDFELAQNNLAWAKLNQESTAESHLTRSLRYYQWGRFAECIQAAQEALNLRPGYAEAWNNIAAAYNSMSKWDEGIRAAEEAIRLKPDFQLARNNLAWAQAQQAKQK
jgi:tetratricopeptide (TPR) repeat protein